MAKDRFHNVVRTALEKEGWVITDDPYELNVGEVDFEHVSIPNLQLANSLIKSTDHNHIYSHRHLKVSLYAPILP